MGRIVMALCLVSGGVLYSQAPNQSNALRLVVVRDSRGVVQGAFQTRPQPYAATSHLPLGVALPKERDHHTEDGLVVNGFGFYAWDEGEDAHVRVFVLLPAPGEENRYLWTAGNVEELLQRRPIADYKLKLGEKCDISEMKKLGISPMSLQLDSKLPK